MTFGARLFELKRGNQDNSTEKICAYFTEWIQK